MGEANIKRLREARFVELLQTLAVLTPDTDRLRIERVKTKIMEFVGLPDETQEG